MLVQGRVGRRVAGAPQSERELPELLLSEVLRREERDAVEGDCFFRRKEEKGVNFRSSSTQ